MNRLHALAGPALLAASLAALASSVWPGLAAAQGSAPGLEISWSPDRPVVGRLFVVRVLAGGGSDVPALVGRFAGESIHFQPFERVAEGDAEGRARSWAVAAVPIDASGALELEVDVRWPDGRVERIKSAIPLGAGSYRMERLTVAPQFGSPLSPELRRRTEEESARAMRVARGAHDTPAFWTTGGFSRPRATRITSGFGNGREFNGQVQSRHMGTDFNGNVGDPVLAPADGVVQVVDAFYLGGNVIYIDHGGGISTGYLHLSEAFVQPGDTVRAGQRVGSVGATGRVTGPHLHWIVRYGGVTVDPLSVVELAIP